MIRGNVQDRPWGKTLGTLASRGVTGQLTVRNHNAWFQIAFEHGHVVAAASSGLGERATVLAYRLGWLSEAQLGALHRRSLAGVDDRELLAEVLPAPQLARLHRQAIAACVARTFAIEHGDFTFDAAVTLRLFERSAAHVVGMIFHGARMYLSEQRLADAVRALGSRFTARQPEHLRHLGLEPRDRLIAEHVVLGTSTTLLDRIADREERRTAWAIAYALVSCGAMASEGPRLPTGAASVPPRKPRASWPRRV